MKFDFGKLLIRCLGFEFCDASGISSNGKATHHLRYFGDSSSKLMNDASIIAKELNIKKSKLLDELKFSRNSIPRIVRIMLQSESSRDVYIGILVLNTFVNNILFNENAIRFCKVRRKNKKFDTELGKLKFSNQLMEAILFQLDTSVEDDFYIFCDLNGKYVDSIDEGM